MGTAQFDWRKWRGFFSKGARHSLFRIRGRQAGPLCVEWPDTPGLQGPSPVIGKLEWRFSSCRIARLPGLEKEPLTKNNFTLSL